MGEGGVGSRGVVKPEERKHNMLRNSIIKYKIKIMPCVFCATNHGSVI